MSGDRHDLAELASLPGWQALVAHHAEVGSLHLGNTQIRRYRRLRDRAPNA